MHELRKYPAEDGIGTIAAHGIGNRDVAVRNQSTRGAGPDRALSGKTLSDAAGKAVRQRAAGPPALASRARRGWAVRAAGQTGATWHGPAARAAEQTGATWHGRAARAAACALLAVTTAGAATPTVAASSPHTRPAVAAPGGDGPNGGGAPEGPGRTALPVIGGSQLASHGVVVNYPAHRGLRLPSVPASAFVVADAGTGQVLAAKDPHGWYRPASTLKVLTAITLMPALNPDQSVVASRWAANTEPSKVGLIAGQPYRVSDLFKALLMISANDAAVALAQAAGSYHKGVAMMNAEARRLQADDTAARTPNGLDAPGQHVSAYDEALFARQALRIPQFMSDEALLRARFPLRPHRRRHSHITLWNQNTMLQTFPGDLGGKIGWTTPAEATFIGWARRHGHTLVVTILHATPLTEMDTAAKLLSWGFAMDGKVAPVGMLVSPLPVTVRHVAHAPRHTSRPRAVRGGLPAAPIGAGAGALAAVVGIVVALISRRVRRAGNRSAP